MIAERRCEEVVTGNGHRYRLAGTFGNIEKASRLAGDPSQLYLRLAEGQMPPGAIKSVIFCALECMDDEPVSPNHDEREAIAEVFIEDFGLQSCAILVQAILSHAIIGDVKKKQLHRQVRMDGMIRKIPFFPLTTSARLGLLWAALSIVSCALVYMIFR